MIFTILVGIIVAMIVANVLITFKDGRGYYKEQRKSWDETLEPEVVSEINPQLIMPLAKTENETDFLDKGKVIANEQKIRVLNERLGNLEKVVYQVAEKGIESGKQEEIDVEKIDFRIKVLEQEIENIKKPKKEEKTFYGQKDDPMEDTIKSLVFNSRKKN